MRLPRPTPSLFISVAALLVAMGGTSYAAATIASRDVLDDSLTGKDIKDDSLFSRDIKDGTLQKRDFRQGSIPPGKRGPAGPAGPAGAGRWVLIDATGQIEAQSGGFSVTAAYPTLAEPNPLRANGNVYLDTNEPLTNNGVFAVVALQNTLDQNGDAITNGRAVGPDANPEFSGEIAVSQCGLPGTACAPPGAAALDNLVVSPRLSDGSVTDNGNRKRFYVIITGDSTDYVAPAA